MRLALDLARYRGGIYGLGGTGLWCERRRRAFLSSFLPDRQREGDGHAAALDWRVAPAVVVCRRCDFRGHPCGVESYLLEGRRIADSSPRFRVAAGREGGLLEATARQLVEQHRPKHLPLAEPGPAAALRPVHRPRQRSDGHHAYRAYLLVPQGWAVFRFTEGDWQLVMVQRLVFIVSPLVAVGAGLRETRPVFRPGDPRCIPSGGTRARTWHWDGTRFTAGPWKQVKRGPPLRNAFFYSPSKNITDCGMLDKGRSSHVNICRASGFRKG